MSMPTFPTVSNSLTREAAVNYLLLSIAYEELALSHIINGEGEKIQFVLGTLEDREPLADVTFDQVIQIDEEVRETLAAVRETEAIFTEKVGVLLADAGEPGALAAENSAAVSVDVN